MFEINHWSDLLAPGVFVFLWLAYGAMFIPWGGKHPDDWRRHG